MAEGDGGQVEWLEGLVKAIRDIHDYIIKESGGVFGEHTASLYSAAARPFHSAFGEFVYSTPVGRAAALFHGIICDHVFVDGNKRTATVVTMSFMTVFAGYPRNPSTLQVRLLGEVALEAASSGLTVEQVAHWLERILSPPA